MTGLREIAWHKERILQQAAFNLRREPQWPASNNTTIPKAVAERFLKRFSFSLTQAVKAIRAAYRRQQSPQCVVTFCHLREPFSTYQPMRWLLPFGGFSHLKPTTCTR